MAAWTREDLQLAVPWPPASRTTRWSDGRPWSGLAAAYVAWRAFPQLATRAFLVARTHRHRQRLIPHHSGLDERAAPGDRSAQPEYQGRTQHQHTDLSLVVHAERTKDFSQVQLRGDDPSSKRARRVRAGLNPRNRQARSCEPAPISPAQKRGWVQQTQTAAVVRMPDCFCDRSQPLAAEDWVSPSPLSVDLLCHRADPHRTETCSCFSLGHLS